MAVDDTRHFGWADGGTVHRTKESKSTWVYKLQYNKFTTKGLVIGIDRSG